MSKSIQSSHTNSRKQTNTHTHDCVEPKTMTDVWATYFDLWLKSWEWRPSCGTNRTPYRINYNRTYTRSVHTVYCTTGPKCTVHNWTCHKYKYHTWMISLAISSLCFASLSFSLRLRAMLIWLFEEEISVTVDNVRTMCTQEPHVRVAIFVVFNWI